MSLLVASVFPDRVFRINTLLLQSREKFAEMCAAIAGGARKGQVDVLEREWRELRAEADRASVGPVEHAGGAA